MGWFNGDYIHGDLMVIYKGNIMESPFHKFRKWSWWWFPIIMGLSWWLSWKWCVPEELCRWDPLWLHPRGTREFFSTRLFFRPWAVVVAAVSHHLPWKMKNLDSWEDEWILSIIDWIFTISIIDTIHIKYALIGCCWYIWVSSFFCFFSGDQWEYAKIYVLYI